MKKTTVILAVLTIFPNLVRADLIPSIPGPDDQGGMVMPMVTIRNADDFNNPTRGEIVIDFNPATVPVLRSLPELSAGSWFAETAAWRADLSSPEGVGGTPMANAGNGDRFNSQHGFMFMAMPMMGSAHIPEGKSLAIRLTGLSSSEMRAFNYLNSQNRWDPIFGQPDSQVLWSGSMWHNVFTLPAAAPAGFYTASFEIFIVNRAFTPGTGFADYTPEAAQAERDPNFSSATVEYSFEVLGAEGVTFAGWLAKNLTVDELAQAERTDPAGDPGGYGIPNLLRYAFDLDARNPARTGLPKAGLASTEEGGETHLTIGFQRPVNALDLEYRIQRTADLAEWETGSGEWVMEVEALEGGISESLIIRDPEPMAETGQRFLRVWVELKEAN